MSYNIYITAAAERDLNRAVEHIEYVLKNPKAAKYLLDEAEKQINSLSNNQKKFQLVEDSVLSSWGIRFVIVKKYLAFYRISEKKNLVVVVRFLYQKSNWNAILSQGVSLK